MYFHVWVLILTSLIQILNFKQGFLLPSVNAIQVVVQEFNNCPNEGSEIEFVDVVLRMDPDSKQLFISGKLNMKRSFDTDLVMKIAIKKCMKPEEIDTCVEYFSAEVDDLCKHMPEKGKPWTAFLEHIKGFKTTCPVPPGNYVVDNAPVSTGSLDNMKGIYGFWRMESRGVDKSGKVVSCSFSAFELRKNAGKKKVPLLD